MEGQQPQPIQDLDQVLGRIQDIVCTMPSRGKFEMIKKKPWVGREEVQSQRQVGKSNEMNFKSFEAVDGSLDDAWASLEKRKLEQVQESLKEGKRLISVRMKEIPLADKHG